MRDQYAGDVSDFLKFAFLRALAAEDRTLGIAWYYVPSNDGRPDGRHLEWRNDAAWRALDQELHARLSILPERSIAALERATIWPRGALFYNEPMPRRPERDAWGLCKRHTLEDADIIFLDPDNGIGKATRKHATFSEVQLLRRLGRTVVFISFPGRTTKHDAQLQRLHERLLVETGAKKVATLRTCVSIPRMIGASSCVPRHRWFTIVDFDAELIERAQTFVTAMASIPRVRATLERAV